MSDLTIRSRTDPARERGATLVEFALVLPLFALFAFGVVEFSLTFTNMNSLRNGAREGARSAVVAEVGTDLSCPVHGAALSNTTKALICRTKVRTDLDRDDVRVKFEWPQLYRPGDPFVVCAQYPVRSYTGLFDAVLGNRTLRTRVEMRIETIDIALEEYAETPPAGGSWSWC